MSKPRQHFFSAFDPFSFGQSGARDHDDGQAELARGVDFCACASAAGIARHQPFDAARAHQFAVAFKRERAARHNHFGVRQWQRAVGRIDEAQRIGVLRLGRERRDMLPANREKHARALLGKAIDSAGDISDFDPVVSRCPAPGRALQRHQRNIRRRASLDCVAAHFGGKGVRRIDHMGDALLADVVGKSHRATKASDPRRQRMAEGNLRASRIGIDRADLLAHEHVREPVGVACSAQDEGAHV